MPLTSFGQSIYVLSDSSSMTVDKYAVLPDRDYSFSQILSDPRLIFIENDSIRVSDYAACWVRIIVQNPSQYTRFYKLIVQPRSNYLFYNFDYDKKKWIINRAGVLADETYDQRIKGIVPCVLKGKTTQTLYARIDLSKLRRYGYALKPKISLIGESRFNGIEQNLWIAWIVAIAVLFLFFLNNVYIYFSFRDKTVLYYLIAQLGGMIYITSYRHFFSVIFHCPVYTFWILPSGWIDYYDLNFLFMHIGILLIMYGFVQFTRSFFDTKKMLPGLNRALKYGLRLYLAITTVITVINATMFYLEHYTMLYENIFALLLISLIFYTCIKGYLLDMRAAGPFLMANMLPLAFMLGTTIFHVVVGFNSSDNGFLPDMAIIAQSFGFSIALVARTKLIQNDLKIKELQAFQLEFDLRELTLTQKLTELENQKINGEIKHEKTLNEILQQRLETNQRELASTTMYIVQKNKLLSVLKGQIQELHQFYPKDQHDGLRNIESILKSDLYLDADWEKFKLHFEKVHPRFFDDLRVRHPNLTKNEIRIYAYFHINLSTKEIASLLNIDPASVRRAKTRLYKKMSLFENA